MNPTTTLATYAQLPSKHHFLSENALSENFFMVAAWNRLTDRHRVEWRAEGPEVYKTMATYCAGGRRHLPQPAYLNCYWFPVVWAFEAHAAHKHPNGEPCPLLQECADFTIADDDMNLNQMKRFLSTMSHLYGLIQSFPPQNLKLERMSQEDYVGKAPANFGLGDRRQSAADYMKHILRESAPTPRAMFSQWNMIFFYATDAQSQPTCGSHAFVISGYDTNGPLFAEISSSNSGRPYNGTTFEAVLSEMWESMKKAADPKTVRVAPGYLEARAYSLKPADLAFQCLAAPTASGGTHHTPHVASHTAVGHMDSPQIIRIELPTNLPHGPAGPPPNLQTATGARGGGGVHPLGEPHR